MKKLTNILIGSLAIVALTACGDDDNGVTGANSNNNQPASNAEDVAQVAPTALRLELKGIEPTAGQHYEGWIVNPKAGPTSTGRFEVTPEGSIISVDASGAMVGTLGEAGAADFPYTRAVNENDLFVLTIEPDGDSDPAPNVTHYVGASVINGKALATLDHMSSVGTSFLQASGNYILATPTLGESTSNRGIWNVMPESETASLNLPKLQDGWIYEGWIVDNETGEAISTGKFSDPAGADSDGAGPAAGPNSPPPFPGQDYIDPAKILNSGVYKTVITVEPYPDQDPGPFSIKILADDIDANAPVMMPIGLQNMSNEKDISVSVTVK